MRSACKTMTVKNFYRKTMPFLGFNIVCNETAAYIKVERGKIDEKKYSILGLTVKPPFSYQKTTSTFPHYEPRASRQCSDVAILQALLSLSLSTANKTLTVLFQNKKERKVYKGERRGKSIPVI